MLERNNKIAAGGLIMVFTDGKETGQYPQIADITASVLQKEAIVHGLLMDGVADDHDLIKLSTQSGGDFCIFKDTDLGGIDYYQCMMNIVSPLGSFAPLEVKYRDHFVPSI